MDFLLQHLGLVALVIASALLLAWPEIQGLMGQQNTVGTLEATQLINQKHAIIIDLRRTQDYEAGHLPQARHIPADNMLSLSLSLNTLKANTYYPLTSSGPNSDDDTGLMMTITEFTTSVYTPIVNYLAAKGLSNQVYILVLHQ